MNTFTPNYKNLIDACRNIEVARPPLYEHIIAPEVMEKILNKEFAGLINGNDTDKREYFTHYCRFFREMGYDTVSYECCIGPAMPGSGALGGHAPGAIKTGRTLTAIPGNRYHSFSLKGTQKITRSWVHVSPQV